VSDAGRAGPEAAGGVNPKAGVLTSTARCDIWVTNAARSSGTKRAFLRLVFSKGAPDMRGPLFFATTIGLRNVGSHGQGRTLLEFDAQAP
jgi:hypothetical protein